MKKENENAALLSMFDELVNEVKKNRLAILQLQNTIQQYDVGKIVDESIFIALNEKFPNKSQIEKDEEAKRHHQAMATWTTQREKKLFEQYIKPTLTPLNGIENKLITVANDLIKEYRKERESQKVVYYKTIMIVILSSLLLISILVFCIVC
jgi:hypothetical protein